jgi:NADH:ubiquinone oxidoreductase subunit E
MPIIILRDIQQESLTRAIQMEKDISEILAQFRKDRMELIPILQRVQVLEHYISPRAIKEISLFLDISENDIYSVASFYPRFGLTRPEG